MAFKSRFASALVLAAASAAACAEPQINVAFAGLADDADGRSLDLDATIAPNDALEFGAGVGSTESSTTSGTLDGTSLRAVAEVHSERLGLRGYYRKWTSNGLDTDTTGGRAFFRTGGLTLSVLGEARGVDLDYTVGATNPQRSTAHFSGTGWGAGASYRWSNWSAYAEGTHYHYGSLSRYVETQTAQTQTPGASPGGPLTSPLPTLPGLPQLPVVPGLPGTPGVPATPGSIGSLLPGLTQSVLYTVPTLSGSFVTLNQGVFDRVITAGLGRDFARSSLHFDWTGANDAVLDTEIDSFSAGYRYSFTNRLNGGVTLGVSHSRYGSVNFGGLSFGISI